MSTYVWVPTTDIMAWARASVEGDQKGATVCVRRADNGEVIEFKQEEFAKLHMDNSYDAIPLEDLTQLADVHDATMLDTLRRRYANDEIFTAIGPVIISVNPYKKVPGCTSEALASLCKMGEGAPPHIARAATVAYNGMTGQSTGDPRAQSILISGESGAGKTEACKLCLLSLAELSSSSGAATEAALESAILLEAFGNAKTVYNDNSSRFGKWCAVHFNHVPNIEYTECQVYLLEKTRVVAPNEGERNYHIFYQMLKGASAEDRSKFKLLKAYDEYAYLRGGVEGVDNVDDKSDYAETVAKMGILGIEGEERDRVLTVIAAVLATGNLDFAGKPEQQFAATDPEWMGRVAALLGVEKPMLEKKLTTREVSAGRGQSTYTVNLTKEECIDSRDALAKAVYVAIFEWIVGALNVFQAKSIDRSRGRTTADEERFIGLLDIFGFENFRHNSFEQLCINFTNEKLQATFMDSLVKLRVEEYEREGVDVKAIEFPDNAAQLALIDGKREGIFAALDDECSVPKGSELGFVEKLHEKFAKGRPKQSDCYDKLKRGKGGVLVGELTGKEFKSQGGDLDRLNFVVVHYAEPVMYTADGWLDKNRGYLRPDLAFVLTQSSSPLMRELFPPTVVDVTKKSSVSSTFRKSLSQLHTTMLQTSQWYVRCIKPNGVRRPDHFDGNFVLRQLRYTGVGAVVEIQRSGYPISIAHNDFINRYRCIAMDHATQILGTALKEPGRACENLLRAGPKLAKLEGSVDWLGAKVAVVGKTRVFMKDEVVRALEAPRLEATTKATYIVQRFARAFIARCIFRILTMHVPRAGVVRKHLAAKSPSEARVALDELSTEWEKAKLPLKTLPLIAECRAEFEELRGEVQTMEEALEAEGEVFIELRAVLDEVGKGGVPQKEAYVKIKVALNAAKEVSKGIKPELNEAIAAAEGMIAACLKDIGLADAAAAAAKALASARESAANPDVTDPPAAAEPSPEDLAAAEEARKAAELAAMEAEVLRMERERENERQTRQAEVERELIASAGTGEMTILKIVLSNDIDMESSVARQLVGYSEKGSGVAFNDSNAVSVLRRGGKAARDGKLQLGDVVIAIDGQQLNGERVGKALNAKPKLSYELTIARLPAGAAGASTGDHSGWLHAVRAKDGKALIGHSVRRFWVIIDGTSVIFKDSQRGRVLKERGLQLKGCEYRHPNAGVKLQGKAMVQKPVIKNYIDKQRFPFTLTWPNAEVDHDVVLAAASSADRAGWKKAIEKVLKALAAQAPTSGWLMKESGRKGNTGFGLAKAFTSGWKQRWFVLEQPDEEAAASFRYYTTPALDRPLGVIVINATAKIGVDVNANKPHSFFVESQGASDPRAIKTVLAGKNQDDLNKWTKAISRAIAQSGGQKTDTTALQDEAAQRTKAMVKISPATANMIAISNLEEEEMRSVKLRELYKVVAYMNVILPEELEYRATRKLKDKDDLRIATQRIVTLIISRRNENKAQEEFERHNAPRARTKSTWESNVGMGGA